MVKINTTSFIYRYEFSISQTNGNNLKNGFIQTDNETKKVRKEEYEKYFIQLNDNTILLSINGILGNHTVNAGERVSWA